MSTKVKNEVCDQTCDMDNHSSEDHISSNVCHICLQTTNSFVNLFSGSKESKDILDTMNLCFNIIIHSDKYLPNTMCYKCIDELNAANNFRQKCILFKERLAATGCYQTDFTIKNMPKLNTTNESVYLTTKHNFTSNENTITSYTKGLIYDCSESEDFADSNSNASEKFALGNMPKMDQHICNNLNENTKASSEINALNDDSHTYTLDNFICHLCSKILKTKTSLLKHLTSMHQKRKHIGQISGFGSTRRYHCRSCSYSTPHSQTLVNHMRRHDGERPYHCQCGKSFTQSSSLSAHQKIHSSTTYFTCTICGKQFKHAYSLKKHLCVHEKGKLICDMCHKVLKSKQALQDHMHRHYNIRNYSCEDCGDTFVTSSELISHRKKHNLNKRVECYFCGYKTHTKKSLILHLKRHMGEKQYKCELCDLKFYTQGDVKRHHRVHTREKPFRCPTCTQQFTYSTSLNKHMLTVHGVHYKWGDFKHKETRQLKSVKCEDSK